MELSDFLDLLIDHLKQIPIDFVNALIEGLAYMINLVASMLPDWELNFTPDIDSFGYQCLQTINWIFPVNWAISCVTFFAMSSAIYFSIGILTRWVKITR